MYKRQIQYSSTFSNNDVWAYLPETKNEVMEISEVLSSKGYEVKKSYGMDASESSFKNEAQNYDLIHLSTHGYFFPHPDIYEIEKEEEVVEELAFRSGSISNRSNKILMNESPMVRSGLVLANGNYLWLDSSNLKTEGTPVEDGLLTALEVSQLDLRKSQLVVLSACETGLGDIKGAEGVYGCLLYTSPSPRDA